MENTEELHLWSTESVWCNTTRRTRLLKVHSWLYGALLGPTAVIDIAPIMPRTLRTILVVGS